MGIQITEKDPNQKMEKFKKKPAGDESEIFLPKPPIIQPNWRFSCRGGRQNPTQQRQTASQQNPMQPLKTKTNNPRKATQPSQQNRPIHRWVSLMCGGVRQEKKTQQRNSHEVEPTQDLNNEGHRKRHNIHICHSKQNNQTEKKAVKEN